MRLSLTEVQAMHADLLIRGETDASSGLINGFRIVTLRVAILCIGGISAFEATAQQVAGWADPLPELDRELAAVGRDDLIARFRDIRDAVNVLKHGYGRSYDRKGELGFRVKERGDAFFHEGDVGEISALVDPDEVFALECITILEELDQALKLDDRFF